MIAKHVPVRSRGKSDFGVLVNYVTDVQSKDHRLGHVRITNCDAMSVQDAVTEVLATQHMNTRAKSDKTYHLIVSFRAGEQPSADILLAIEKRICIGLGYGEHQRVSAIHNDTDNLHIHIAINKIHPTRYTLHEPYYSHRLLAELCTTLERDYDLERDNHEPRQRGAEGRAHDMERHAGVESLIGWIKRECLGEIKSAQSWQELHQVMRDNGLKLRERANGLVIEASDGTMIKASTLARDLSKPKLESRFGSFEVSPESETRTKAKREYQKNPIPLRVSTVDLYTKYKAEQQTLTVTRGQALDHARQHRDRLVETAKRSNRLRRATIKVVGESRTNKKVLYAQASKTLCDEVQKINKQYQKNRQSLYESYSRLTWADWLKKEASHGNAEALTALRAREAAHGLKGNTIQGLGDPRPGHASPVKDNITKKGVIIYRVGLSAVRDDGDKLQVSHEASREGLQAALRLAMERGSRITVNGTTKFRAQIIRVAVDFQLPITFADDAMECRRLSLLNKEKTHERPDQVERSAEHRGRTGRSSGGFGQRAEFSGGYAGAVYRKPDIGRIGRVPPPSSQNCLRTLSQLDVVRIDSRGQVLLPSDVSNHLEQQGAQSDNKLRRGVSRSGTRVDENSQGFAAVDKFIAENESARPKLFDISKYTRYTAGEGTLIFQSVRYIDGQALVLLKRGDEIMVMSIDQTTAQRLSRVEDGEAVTITPNGVIKTSKGRSR